MIFCWSKNKNVYIELLFLTCFTICTNYRIHTNDAHSTRLVRLQSDKFALISDVWNRFVDSCISCYKPRANITIDQWFPTDVSRKRSKRSQLMCRENVGKNYLGTLNFAVFVREIRRERKSVSSGGNLFSFRDQHDFGTKIEKSLRNFQQDLFIINQYNGCAAKI